MVTGVIFKIAHKKLDIVYIGATRRCVSGAMAQYKAMYRAWLDAKADGNPQIAGGACSIFKYFAIYGVDSFELSVIKRYVVCDDLHLNTKKQLWINKFNQGIGCVNEKHMRCLMAWHGARTYEEYVENIKQESKNRSRLYYQKNKEAVRAKNAARTVCDVCGKGIRVMGLAKHKLSKGCKPIAQACLSNDPRKVQLPLPKAQNCGDIYTCRSLDQSLETQACFLLLCAYTAQRVLQC